MAHPSRRARARLRPALSALALALPTALLLPLGAAAGEGGSGYQGTFSSNAPSGYQPAPAVSAPGSPLTYAFTVTNTGPLPATLTGSVYTERVTSVDGTDVSSGSPAFSEQAVLQGTTAGDPSRVAGDLGAQTLLPGQSVAMSYSVSAGACGYLVIWAGQSGSRADASQVLNQGAVRVTGCATPPPPTPRPTPVPPPPPPATAPPSRAAAAPPNPATAPPTPRPSTMAGGAGGHGSSPTPNADRHTVAPAGQQAALSPGRDAPPLGVVGAYAMGSTQTGIGGQSLVVAAAVLLAGLAAALIVVRRQRRAAGDGSRP